MPGGNQATAVFKSPGRGPVGCVDFSFPFIQPTRYQLSGITKDFNGAALGTCTVMVFNQNKAHLATVTSNVAGEYSIAVTGAAGQTFYAVAYKAGSPDVAGTTVNTLVAVNA